LTYAALGRGDVDVLQAICDYSGYKSKYGKKEVIHRMYLLRAVLVKSAETSAIRVS
jgi:hypothetical protein